MFHKVHVLCREVAPFLKSPLMEVLPVYTMLVLIVAIWY